MVVGVVVWMRGAGTPAPPGGPELPVDPIDGLRPAARPPTGAAAIDAQPTEPPADAGAASPAERTELPSPESPGTTEIGGLVIDGATESPIGGAHVVVAPDEAGGSGARVQTDEQGRFRGVLAAGTARVAVLAWAPDHVATEARFAVGAQVVIRLQRGVRIHGRVVRAGDGAPLAGAVVSIRGWDERLGALPPEWDSWGPERLAPGRYCNVTRAVSDDGGNFSAAGVAGRWFALSCHLPGHISETIYGDTHIGIVEAAECPVVLQLHRLFVSSLRVTDARSGAPISDYDWVQEEGTLFATRLPGGIPEHWPRDVRYWVWYEASLGAEAPTSVSLSIRRVGYRPAGVELPVQAAADSGPPATTAVALEPLTEAWSEVWLEAERRPEFSGLLLPVSVHPIGEGPWHADAVWRDVGERPVALRLPAGRYEIRTAMDVRESQDSLPHTSSRYTVELHAGVSGRVKLPFAGRVIRVRTVSASRAGIPDVELVVLAPGAEAGDPIPRHRMVADAPGELRFVVDGRACDLLVSKAGYASRRVSVPAGDSSPVELVIALTRD